MELWSHNRTPGLSYARIAYHYARPGAIDDHRGLMPGDLKIPALPAREPKAVGGAAGAKFHYPDALGLTATSGKVETVSFPLATQLKIALWHAEKGAQLKFSLPVEQTGRAGIRLVAVHRPEGATVRVLLDGKPLLTDGGGEAIRLKSAHASRVLNVHFQPTELRAGTHEITLECVESGLVGLDYVWVKKQ